ALLAPVVTLIVARGLLVPRSREQISPRFRGGLAAAAAAFLAAAGGSSALALANAPVGPDVYSPGVRELADRFAGRSTLLIAPDDVISDQHGRDFYSWELREASAASIAPASSANSSEEAPPHYDLVLTLDGVPAPPYSGLDKRATVDAVTLWRVKVPLGR
ncbi:MAG: hypothetical protein H0V25_00925, partial [Solirubrobacterales bacterium]|nr:hypothetical protein [Solirubrobacterales bacterium]